MQITRTKEERRGKISKKVDSSVMTSERSLRKEKEMVKKEESEEIRAKMK